MAAIALGSTHSRILTRHALVPAERAVDLRLSGAAIMLTVLGLNLLGDGLRDLLDPTLRGEGAE